MKKVSLKLNTILVHVISAILVHVISVRSSALKTFFSFSLTLKKWPSKILFKIKDLKKIKIKLRRPK